MVQNQLTDRGMNQLFEEAMMKNNTEAWIPQLENLRTLFFS